MKIEIFDVGHGGCVVITGPNGKRLMLDCGFRTEPNFFPSVTFGGEAVELLAMMNLDEDHLDDLPYVWDKVTIKALYSNPSVTAVALKSMKKQGMRRGVQKAHALLEHFGPGRTGPIADLGAVDASVFHNTFGAPFTDTNNLSLAVFVQYGGFTILFGGDLECAGWRELLAIPNFRAKLAATRIFVASHHGRESGQCQEIFDIVRPDLVIFSDDAKQYETQNTDAWYRQRVKGIPRLDIAPDPVTGIRKMRHVMTTRRDGTMTIDVDPVGNYLVTPTRQDYPALAKLFPTGIPQPPSLASRYLLGQR
jgi:beta-lactamase superfamily II metal-dependent hydrolase